MPRFWLPSGFGFIMLTVIFTTLVENVPDQILHSGWVSEIMNPRHGFRDRGCDRPPLVIVNAQTTTVLHWIQVVMMKSNDCEIWEQYLCNDFIPYVSYPFLHFYYSVYISFSLTFSVYTGEVDERSPRIQNSEVGFLGVDMHVHTRPLNESQKVYFSRKRAIFYLFNVLYNSPVIPLYLFYVYTRTNTSNYMQCASVYVCVYADARVFLCLSEVHYTWINRDVLFFLLCFLLVGYFVVSFFWC